VSKRHLPITSLRGPAVHGPAIVLFLALAASCVGCGDSVERVRDLQAEGDYEASVEPLRRLLDERPGDPEIHYLYGLALARTGKPSAAMWALLESSRDPAWAARAGLEVAGAALGARDFTAAVAASDAVLAVDPENAEALRMRGLAHLELMESPEESLADFDRLLEQSPEDFAALLYRMTALLALEEVDEARAVLEEVRRIGTESLLDDEVVAHFCLIGATFAEERDELELAERLFEECSSTHPTSAVAAEESMRFFDGHGRRERATQILADRLALLPNSTQLRGQLARRLRGLGDVAAAEALLLEATEAESPDVVAHAWSALTDHYLELDDLPAAVKALEAALYFEGELSPQRTLAYADLLAAAGMNARAMEVASELEDEDLRVLIEARVALNEKRPRRALEAFERAFQTWPNNAVARYYAARAAEQSGFFERAVEHYRQSIRADRDSTDASLRLARLLSASGNAPDAFAVLSQHHLGSRPGDPEGLLLALRLAVEQESASLVRGLIDRIPASRTYARATVLLAERVARSRSTEEAIRGLREDAKLDPSLPRDAPALAYLVDLLIEAGEVGEARALVDSARAAHPDAPEFLVIHAGSMKEGGGGRKALYEKALALDPNNLPALLALAEMAAGVGDHPMSISLLDRAAAAAPGDIAASRRAAEARLRGGLPDEAESRLEGHLQEFPFDAAAALSLAELREKQNRDRSRTLELVQRAQRFAGTPRGVEISARLEALQRALGL